MNRRLLRLMKLEEEMGIPGAERRKVTRRRGHLSRESRLRLLEKERGIAGPEDPDPGVLSGDLGRGGEL